MKTCLPLPGITSAYLIAASQKPGSNTNLGGGIQSSAWKEPSFAELDTWITPVDRFFVRHHLGVPPLVIADWSLVIEGVVEHRLELTYQNLLSRPRVTEVVTFECAGNLPGGGMVGTARWTGIRLGSLLAEAGIKPEAVEVVLYGADSGIDEGENVPVSYARSIPIQKAVAPETLLAFEMNGQTLRPEHGFPVRLVVPGWYAMANVKWLTRIKVTDRPFTGFYMSKRYFTAKRDSVTGEFLISPVREMGVKSQIARPRDGELLRPEEYVVRGAAWAGRGGVERVEVSTDAGNTWHRARLGDEHAPFAWTLWEYRWQSPQIGEHTLLVRAFDDRQLTQPQKEEPQRINRYANRWIHRIRIKVLW